VFFAALAAASAAPPIPRSDGTPPAPPPFKFPLVPPALDPPPMPRPVPGAALTLTGDTVYVIPHDEPFLLFASPAPLVTITRETGPVKIRGKFLDSKGKIETRTYSQKFLAIVEAAPGAKGRAELIAVPAGITDEAKAERQAVEVDAGQGPQPPPDDGKKEVAPPPKPTPPPVPPDPNPAPKPKPTGPLWFVIVYENDSLDVDTAAVINDSAFWDRQRAAGNQFKPFDQNEPNAKKLGYVKAATQDQTDASGNVIRQAPGLPALIVVDPSRPNRNVIRAVPCPKSTAEIVALEKEVRQ
jgi:hypothetical protein